MPNMLICIRFYCPLHRVRHDNGHGIRSNGLCHSDCVSLVNSMMYARIDSYSSVYRSSTRSPTLSFSATSGSSSTASCTPSAYTCPQANGQTVTDCNTGSVYTIQCNTTHSGTIGQNTTAPDLPTCLNNCSSNPSCQAVAYNTSTGVCSEYYGQTNGSRTYSPNVVFAQLKQRAVVIAGGSTSYSLVGSSTDSPSANGSSAANSGSTTSTSATASSVSQSSSSASLSTTSTRSGSSST
jgi:hypothetical protein